MYFRTFSVVIPDATDVNTEQVTEGIHGLWFWHVRYVNANGWELIVNSIRQVLNKT